MFQTLKNWAAEKRFRELILYVCGKEGEDPRFGAVKLNKVLYYVDVQAYRELGRPISGDEYQHLPEGPAPRHFLPVRASLLLDGSAVMEETVYQNAIQKRIRPQRRPDLSVFTAEEIGLIDSVLEQYRGLNGREITAISHAEIGWRITGDGETIPFETAWLSSQDLTQEQIEMGQSIAREHGLVPPG